MPVRLAHMIEELDAVPQKYWTSASKRVRGWYVESFQELVNFEDGANLTEEHVERFTDMIRNIMKRHDPVVTTVASGLQELKTQSRDSFMASSDLHLFLDRFYASRIGIRMLQSQHRMFLLLLKTSANTRTVVIWCCWCKVGAC